MTNESASIVKLVTVRAWLRSGKAREIRVAAGLSLREVSDAVGIAVATLHRWESLERRPTGAAAVRYADLLQELQEARTEAAAVP